MRSAPWATVTPRKVSGTTALLTIVVITAVAFDFTNGFHDTANAMATTIATRALPPRIAVGVAAVLNFVGAFLSISVAATIAKGIVDQGAVTLELVFAGLIGAILWNVFTWYLSIPSSSSHALIGGMLGAMLAAVGSSGVEWKGVIAKVAVPAILAPIVAGLAAFTATRLSYRLTRRVDKGTSSSGFKLGQIGSSSLVALAHGTNDAQKTMGVIVLALVAADRLDPDAAIPLWVKVVCATAIAAGTYSGGWRVIRTLGSRVTDLEPTQGFSAESASGATILASSYFGYPLSTTQVIAGGITGTGLGRRGSAVNWNVISRMVSAWVLTLPAAGAVGALTYGGTQLFGGGTIGALVTGAMAVAVLAYLFILSRRDPVNADNVVVTDEISVPAPDFTVRRAGAPA
jgi:PiT family inorganic phosphate transporter